MSAPPEWTASVVEVWDDGDTFTVDLRREGNPDLLAEMSMKRCGITVEPGDLLIVTTTFVTKRDLGVWTQEDINAITRSTRELAETMRLNVE